MQIWFVQGFTTEIKVFYAIGKNKVEEEVFNDPDIDAVISSVNNVVKDESKIQLVHFLGTTKILKEIRKYYDRKGVDVEWQ